MKSEFLTRLFWEASSQKGQPSAARRISQLYERTQQTTAAWDPIYDLLPKLDVKELDAFENAAAALADAFEQQGFLNGFRMGMMLANELNVSELDTGEGKSNAG